MSYVIQWNTNRIELDSWVERRKRPDGDYDLIGMGRRREYNPKTGALLSDKVEPTGLVGWAPCEAIEPPKPPKPSWFARFFG